MSFWDLAEGDAVAGKIHGIYFEDNDYGNPSDSERYTNPYDTRLHRFEKMSGAEQDELGIRMKPPPIDISKRHEVVIRAKKENNYAPREVSHVVPESSASKEESHENLEQSPRISFCDSEEEEAIARKIHHINFDDNDYCSSSDSEACKNYGNRSSRKISQPEVDELYRRMKPPPIDISTKHVIVIRAKQENKESDIDNEFQMAPNIPYCGESLLMPQLDKREDNDLEYLDDSMFMSLISCFCCCCK